VQSAIVILNEVKRVSLVVRLLVLLDQLEDAAAAAAVVAQLGRGLDELDAALVFGVADGQADLGLRSGLKINQTCDFWARVTPVCS